MQVAYHIGVHCTDEDRLLKCLLKNKEALTAQGISVPGPSRYRKLIRESIQSLQGQPPAPGTRDILLDAIVEEDNVDRLVMSYDGFICIPPRVFEQGQFYRLIEPKLAGLRHLFHGDEIELFMGLRNPATFLPALYKLVADRMSFDDFLQGYTPDDLRWSDVCARIRAALPEAQLTVWCNEDTPLIWGQLIREISGLDPQSRIVGGFDLLSEIMSAEGMQRFRAYLKTHPPQTEVQKRRVIAAFLDKFALPEAIEEELDLPGWSEEVVDRLSEQYDEDVYRLARLPGVTFIAP